MAAATHDSVARLWNFCTLLKDACPLNRGNPNSIRQIERSMRIRPENHATKTG